MQHVDGQDNRVYSMFFSFCGGKCLIREVEQAGKAYNIVGYQYYIQIPQIFHILIITPVEPNPNLIQIHPKKDPNTKEL